MLKIKNLKAGIENIQILNGINLSVNSGEVHAIMGPNGSGKSTLSSVIAGKEDYEVSEGEISFANEDLLSLAPEERAHKGVFLSFQYPIEIPGISVSNFIKTSINEKRKANIRIASETPENSEFIEERFALAELHLQRNQKNIKWFHRGFKMDFVSKISSPEDHKVYI